MKRSLEGVVRLGVEGRATAQPESSISPKKDAYTLAAERNGLSAHQLMRMRILARSVYRGQPVDLDQLAREAKEDN